MVVDVLTLIAELGVGYAGFVAIFLIFARRAGKFSPANSVRVRALIFASFATIGNALIPLVLMVADFKGPALWRAASLLVLGASIPGVVSLWCEQRRLDPADRAEMGKLNETVSWGLQSSAADCWS